ncbi:MAG: zinc-binding dehydrogenase [Candidatus Marinimicrobia bacterium]|nr:zinc-binding dehydrogenase [Candidatus Neomarinimicrobiota bacterium]MCF7828221.1 zinc-binding dehydrogenase [Candidatus Neomarinimicrobiota bacterium]MCF7879604.1 zinc-binding dehydrogenase [Candidatus Neomarinimicrobiota bacterium]
MKAAVFRKPYSTMEIEDWDTPVPGAREVLIKVAACGVCHTDLHFIDHGVPPLTEPPVILGHEITGTVETVGEAVDSVKKGQRVLVPVVIPCGECTFCQCGKTNLCRERTIPGNKIHGGYAEYVKVPVSGALPLPDEVPLETGAVLADAFGTSFHAIVDVGKIQKGETLLVFGAGGLGTAAIQIAKHAGARVIALDMNPLKLQWAEEMGADETVNSHGIRDLGAHVRDLTDGGVDVAYEAIGAPRTIYQAFTCLGPEGRLIVAGYTRNEVKFPEPNLIFEERSIFGVLGCPVSSYYTLFEHVVAGDYDIEALATKRMPLEEIEKALTSVRSGQTLRTILTPWQD